MDIHQGFYCWVTLTGLQADDEAIKQKLTELIAKEKAKAEAKEEKKRSADSGSEPIAKRPKTKGNKKK